MPLLSREVQMSDITVNGLNLTLSRDEQGRGNWEGVGQPAGRREQAGEPPKAAEPQTEQREEASPARKPLTLDIDSLTVSDARVTYSDAKTGQQYSAESIELTTGAIREGSSIPVKLNAFFGSNQPVMRARTELQGALRFDNQLKRYQFEDMRLSGEASGEPLQGQTLTFSAQGQLLVDLAAQIAEWNSLKFTANQLRGLGELKARDLDKEPKISGAMTVAQFNLREFLQGTGQQLPAMADGNALNRAELVSRLSGTANSLALEELTLKLDDSTFTGRIAISDFARQALRVDLKGDRLNLDRYLPPPSNDEPAGAARKSEVKNTQAAAVGSGSTAAQRTDPAGLERGLGAAAGSAAQARQRGQPGHRQPDRHATATGGLQPQGPSPQRPAEPAGTARRPLRRTPGQQRQPRRAPAPAAADAAEPLQRRANRAPAGKPGRRGGGQGPAEPGCRPAHPGQQPEGLGRQPQRQGRLHHRQRRAGRCQPRAAALPRHRHAQPQAAVQRATQQGHPLPRTQGQPDPAQRRGQQPRPQGQHPRPDGQWQWRCRPARAGHGLSRRHRHRRRQGRHAGPCLSGQRALRRHRVAPALPRPLELGAKACRFDNDALGKIAARLAGERLNEKIEEKLGDKVSPELKDALKGLFKR